MKEINNVAYIDGANLHKGVNSLGWKLDYARFRIWLKDKYKINRQDKCSILLKRTGARIAYINDQRSLLELSIKEKAPDGD